MNAGDQERLLAAAREARNTAYVPYSGFDAGAAVLTAEGEVVRGALVENIVFGLSMCAERVALYAAVAGGGVPVGLALSAPSTGSSQTYPCGPCLQVALELGGDQMTVTVDDGAGGITRRVGDLAPEMPRGKSLAQRKRE